LKPEISVPVALATGVVVFAIFQNATPPYVDQRAAPPNDPDLSKATKLATWTAAGAVSAISLIAKDPVVFMVGGTAVIVMAWWGKHGNAVNPMTGRASTMPAPSVDNNALAPDLAYQPV
jgi:hypothetical protein